MATATGVQPKRKRGHARVAAIMQAGVEVFMEKGFDAATMTEIAARSGTAIASLYRFFPSKESLADALLMDYARYALGAYAELRARAAKMTPDDLAGALVDIRLELKTQRRFVIELVEARGGSEDIKKQFRKTMLDEISGLLRATLPNLSKARSEVMAAVVMHVLKGVSAAVTEPAAVQRLLLAEIRELIRLYLLSAKRSDSQSAGASLRVAPKPGDRSHE
jgi:AcrR family transcriptional regulator